MPVRPTRVTKSAAALCAGGSVAGVPRSEHLGPDIRDYHAQRVAGG